MSWVELQHRYNHFATQRLASRFEMARLLFNYWTESCTVRCNKGFTGNPPTKHVRMDTKISEMDFHLTNEEVNGT